MKRFFLSLTLLVLGWLCLGLSACKFAGQDRYSFVAHREQGFLNHLAQQGYRPQSGDVIFQQSKSNQAQAIQLTTNSRYSHMGILLQRDDGTFQVLEGSQPTRWTPLERWVNKGVKRHFVIKRLKADQTPLTEEQITQMKQAGEALLGCSYDFLFAWGDEAIYCSELVWKLYQREAGIELGEKQSLGEFDLSRPEVAPLVRQRYGDKPPLEQELISPAAMFGSPLLETVAEG